MSLPTIARRNYGRNHAYTINGEKVPGVTTIIGDGLPKPALVAWGPKVVAEFVADRLDEADGHVVADSLVNDLGDLAARKSKPWPDRLSRTKVAEILKGVHWEDRDQAANRGTQVHNLAEKLTHGEEVDVPEELTGHVDAYLAFLEEFDPTDVLTEIVVGSAKHRYCGTLDMIATLGGERWLLDIKTNRSGPFGEVALQLAAYRYAEVAVVDGECVPMPEVDRCGVIWLRADGFDLFPYQAGPVEHRMFLYVQQVGRWLKAQKDPMTSVRGDAVSAADLIGASA